MARTTTRTDTREIWFTAETRWGRTRPHVHPGVYHKATTLDGECRLRADGDGCRINMLKTVRECLEEAGAVINRKLEWSDLIVGDASKREDHPDNGITQLRGSSFRFHNRVQDPEPEDPCGCFG